MTEMTLISLVPETPRFSIAVTSKPAKPMSPADKVCAIKVPLVK
jgi:hypothetical protein